METKEVVDVLRRMADWVEQWGEQAEGREGWKLFVKMVDVLHTMWSMIEL